MGDARETKRDELIVVATNRKARHEYAIEDTFEAGLVLTGSEVKSLRAGTVTMGDGYVVEHGGELYLVNVHINEYPQAGRMNHLPTGRRKLLLHRREIAQIVEEMHQRGRSCIPMRFYFKKGRCKVELAIATGKKLHDKREDMKDRDAKRELDRVKRTRGRDED